MSASIENRPLRIVVVARRVPIPIFTGINLVVHHLTRRLAEAADVLMLVTDDDTPAKIADLPINIVGYGKSGYGDDGATSAGQEGYRDMVARYYGVPLSRTRWLEQRVADFKPDVVIGFGYDLAPYLQPLLSRWPVVFDPIDSEVLYLWRLLRSGRLRLTTIKHLIMSIALARQVLRRGDALITVSDEDTDNLRRVTGNPRVGTVPNGVDCQFFAPQDGVVPVSGRVVFSGSLSWLPNSQAIEWFLEHCWDQILARRPDASLHLVGKGMTVEQGRFFAKYRNVHPVGFVDDIRTHILAAELAIAPMISGSGIKNKVLESWALGRAVVATPLAARGLIATAGEHLLVAGEPAQFTLAVLSVLDDSKLRDKLGSAGRSLATSRYSWESSAARFSTILSQVIAGPGITTV